MQSLDLVILGAGGHGAELASYVRDIQSAGTPVRLLGFIDDGKPAGPISDLPVLGGFGALAKLLDRRGGELLYYITAVGDNATRRRLVARAEQLDTEWLRPWTLRHPSAQVGDQVVIGDGTCLAPGAIVTSRVRIGRHCILNVKASVSHDSNLADFCNINPSATLCGNVNVSEGAYVGAGATVIQRTTIGAWSIVGAGAVVIADVPANVTAVGVPARVIKTAPR
jgi:sugar O-acyltransferase (sialic acid O-acetyltransferase NeuD family)